MISAQYAEEVGLTPELLVARWKEIHGQCWVDDLVVSMKKSDPSKSTRYRRNRVIHVQIKDKDRICELYQSGICVLEISHRLGHKEHNIYRVLKERNIRVIRKRSSA